MRIDMIFSLDVPTDAKRARVVGATVSDKMPPPGLGLWPSDHGNVVANLQCRYFGVKIRADSAIEVL
jgi:hypothetical protein